jgi:hypothetical protein
VTKPGRKLLGGHVFGTLTKDEERELYREALDDQEVFDALAEDEELREALADPALRRELVSALDRPTLRERLRAWLHQPATLGHLSVATAVVFVAFTSWLLVAPEPLRGVLAGEGTPASQEVVPADPRRAFFALPMRTAIPVTLEGEGSRLRFQVPKAARALVLHRKPNGRIEQLFPAPGAGSAIALGQEIAVTASQEPGLHRVRLLVSPPEVEPLSLDPRALGTVVGRLTVLERTYPVGTGGGAR